MYREGSNTNDDCNPIIQATFQIINHLTTSDIPLEIIF